jgi:hypothetical protein
MHAGARRAPWDSVARYVCRRGLPRLDPDELPHCFLARPHALSERRAGEIVAIEGKILWRSLDRAASKAAIHMGSAWAKTNRLVLGQLKGDAQLHESTAIPRLLALWDLQGCMVTLEAMGCQKDLAHAIPQQNTDDVLALKEHHPTLDEDVPLLMHDAKAHNGDQGH